MKIAVIIGIILGIAVLLCALCLLVAYLLHKRIFGKRFEPDPLVKYYTKEEFELDSEPVSFLCGKVVLRGAVYSHNPVHQNKIIVYAHGMWSSTRAYMQDIAYLCYAGYPVLGFDYTGTDTSEGKSLRGLAQGLKSMDSAISFLKTSATYKHREILVVGHSWGGFIASAIVKYHPDIRRIVAIAPFVSIPQVLKGMLPKRLWWTIPFVCMIEFMKCGGYALSDTQKILSSYSGKALILHSEDDFMVAYRYNTALLQKECQNDNVVYRIVNGKGHHPHYSMEAVLALKEYSKTVATLTKEQLSEFQKKTDYHKLGELDSEIMQSITDFLKA